jgi:hypothetical protein
MSACKIDYPELFFNPGDPQLEDLGSCLWYDGESRLVEFFPSRFTVVSLLNTTDPRLPDVLEKLNPPITVDFE